MPRLCLFRNASPGDGSKVLKKTTLRRECHFWRAARRDISGTNEPLLERAGVYR